MHFGATLRLLRVGAGVGLRSLAGEIGVSGAYLSRVEHGHDPPPTSDRLVEIAAVLGVPPETLLDLAERLDPVVSTWAADEPAAGRLVRELARRRLGPAQLARVLAFVEAEFPLDRNDGPQIGELLPSSSILLGVRVGTVDDLLELAALRVAPADPSPVAHALRSREKTSCTAVGQGLLVPNCVEPVGRPAAVLATLASPLDVPTPDGRPLRAMLALVGIGSGPEALRTLAAAAALARPDRMEALVRARSTTEAARVVAGVSP